MREAVAKKKAVKSVDSAVDQAANALRAYALSRENGDFLGSEEDLIERLGVSRPTLRQASAKVVQEHLISIRRGVGGGYFARTPGSISVSRMAALYLMSRNAGLSEITAAMKPLRAELAMRAARNRDPELQDRLRAFVAEGETQEASGGNDGHGYREFLRSEREFGRILGEMSANSVLILLLEILYDFASYLRREQDVLRNRPERVRTYSKLRAKMARAILEGDVEVAELSSHRCSDLIDEWMHIDFQNARFDDTTMNAD
ncbi:FCD domain-containing protein [Sphingobium sp. AS12]|uniref:FadR/GntR family transcriptional regulator n=1 Tax=Sphingobium sp. AS12 TaxID=2849495 RepID=UPI001C316E57|nr:FCD domain-containing protein [Sphingobium sp. AS12]MBV2149111.1 FCD domain-containing protein [Sphingobium sp. AS12]